MSWISYDIPIALITDQYLEEMMRMQELNWKWREFLLMAATLIYLKSKHAPSSLAPVLGRGGIR